MACFSRPEAKVERLSYPVITPSAARGIFDAILWQPGIYWQLTQVEMLAPLRTIGLTRNEVKQRGPRHDTVLRWAQGIEPMQPLLTGRAGMATGNRRVGQTQRQTVALRDVAYRLHARMVSLEGQCLKARDAQFRRRVQRGQCVRQPFLGNKEMVAYFRFPQPGDPDPHRLDLDLGLMLYDVFRLAPPDAGKVSVSLFQAALRQGVMEVPEYHSSQVLKVGQ